MLHLMLALLGCVGEPSTDFAPAQTVDSAPDTGPFDADGDGFVARVDCDDADPEVFPGAFERPYDGVDNDCDPETLDDDLDQDGFPEHEDCDDRDPSLAPDQPDLPCDGRDQDCSGVADDAGSTVVLSTSPRGLLPPGEDLLIELSDPPDALARGAVRLQGEVSGLIEGALSVSGSTLRFTPDRPPAPGERLHLTLRPLPAGDGQGLCQPHVSLLYAGAADANPAGLAEVDSATQADSVEATLAFDGADAGWPRALTQSGGALHRHAAGGLSEDAELTLPDGAQLSAVADLNLDGAPELIAHTDDAVYVASGGAGWASEPWTRVALDYAQIVELALSDVDGDGDLDVLAAVNGHLGGVNRVHVLYNDDTGLLVPAVRGAELAGRPLSMSPGDLDADGDLDFTVATSSATLDTLINDGLGTLTLDLTLPTSARLQGLQAADLDQDGDAELIAASDDGELWVIASEGAVLNTLHQTPLGFVAAESQLADWDGDGDLDVLAVGAGGACILQAQDDRSLSLTRTLSGAERGLGLDQDGDGDLEVLLARGAELSLYDAL